MGGKQQAKVTGRRTAINTKYYSVKNITSQVFRGPQDRGYGYEVRPM